MTLLLAGATGLIGHAVMAQWAAAAPGDTLHALVRRPLATVPAGVQPLLVDFSALPAVPAADAALCALGTGRLPRGGFRRRAGLRARRAGGRRAALRGGVSGGRQRAQRQLLQPREGRDGSCRHGPGLRDAADRTPLAADRRPQRAWPAGAPRRSPGANAHGAAGRAAAWRPIAGETVARALLHTLRTAPAGVQVLDNARLHHEGHPQGHPA
jgi:hypothetical protein